MKETLKILALYGRYDTGKTASINELIDILAKKPNVDKIFILPNIVERIAAFKVNEKIVAITTRGDRKIDLENDFERLLKELEKDGYAPDILICAARSSGKTHEFLYENALDENIYWFSKSAIYRKVNDTLRDQDDIDFKALRNEINGQTAEQLYEVLTEHVL